jgi:ferredoxin
MPVVHFIDEDVRITVEEGANLRKIALKNGISPYKGLNKIFNCRGNGLCGTCRVEIVEGKGASAQSQGEVATLRGLIPFYARMWRKDVRLSCFVEVKGDMQVKTYPAVELDKEETVLRWKNLAAVIFIGGGFLLMVIWILLDMLKKV